MDSIIAVVNNNKVLWGLSMLLLNFGSRYVIADLGKTHEIILSSEISKKVIVFAMFFVATRDILTSFLLTLSYILIIDGILHEKRKFCLLPSKIVNEARQNTVKSINKDDYVKAKHIVETFETMKTNKSDLMESEKEELTKKQLYANYLTNVEIAKSS